MQAGAINIIERQGKAAIFLAAADAEHACKLGADVVKAQNQLRLHQQQYGSLPPTDIYSKYYNEPQFFLAYTNFTPIQFDSLMGRLRKPSDDKPHFGRPRSVSIESEYMLVLSWLKGGKKHADLLGEMGTSAGRLLGTG